jgi:hypothetical protein
VRATAPGFASKTSEPLNMTGTGIDTVNFTLGVRLSGVVGRTTSAFGRLRIITGDGSVRIAGIQGAAILSLYSMNGALVFKQLCAMPEKSILLPRQVAGKYLVIAVRGMEMNVQRVLRAQEGP